MINRQFVGRSRACSAVVYSQLSIQTFYTGAIFTIVSIVYLLLVGLRLYLFAFLLIWVSFFPHVSSLVSCYREILSYYGLFYFCSYILGLLCLTPIARV